jgi:hypothetical protein
MSFGSIRPAASKGGGAAGLVSVGPDGPGRLGEWELLAQPPPLARVDRVTAAVVMVTVISVRRRPLRLLFILCWLSIAPD